MKNDIEYFLKKQLLEITNFTKKMHDKYDLLAAKLDGKSKDKQEEHDASMTTSNGPSNNLRKYYWLSQISKWDNQAGNLTHVEELCGILKEVKKESDDDEKVLEVEKLLGAGDYIDDEPVFLVFLKAIDVLEDLPIQKIKLKALQMKMLVKDIEKNKYRISSIFSRLQNAENKKDEQYILKRLGREELLSPEQFSQLSKLEEINSQSIADVIKEIIIADCTKKIPSVKGNTKSNSNVTENDMWTW